MAEDARSFWTKYPYSKYSENCGLAQRFDPTKAGNAST
jgi:hypothetical protein